ncbi:hypothetical protein VP01_2209g2 [Puccinia sorghi]|uniref:Uncharacterized protein n=1 Tax=Puccinia sorghi TaxID=27349 RepID=A0A0L6V9H5_9BASI|nr:hypothetical protein VP01_2209g2 [Puccinia sorghi]
MAGLPGFNVGLKLVVMSQEPVLVKPSQVSGVIKRPSESPLMQQTSVLGARILRRPYICVGTSVFRFKFVPNPFLDFSKEKIITPKKKKKKKKLKEQQSIYLWKLPSDAVSNEIKNQRSKNKRTTCQTALQNQILANQKDAIVTMANKKIMSIDILTIRASHFPFYERRTRDEHNEHERQMGKLKKKKIEDNQDTTGRTQE